ncbi:hypothetical protein E6O75_ATG01094 [Venturia nashicola]|uniref:Uncharacterized protein n=1 Tax=Venturia nashicola TaxID=86259 RepID=A0A4Z1PL40_9PEZI|nr:hypothetical protein E6O75_ATG01094 [Venturia nashicola]
MHPMSYVSSIPSVSFDARGAVTKRVSWCWKREQRHGKQVVKTADEEMEATKSMMRVLITSKGNLLISEGARKLSDHGRKRDRRPRVVMIFTQVRTPSRMFISCAASDSPCHGNNSVDKQQYENPFRLHISRRSSFVPSTFE